MTRLSLFCLHLLARLVLWIHLSVCLPLFVCRHHLPAFLFFFFFQVKRAALFRVFGPFAMFAPLTPPYRIHAFLCGTNFFFFLYIPAALKRIEATLIQTWMFSESYERICWLIYAASCPSLGVWMRLIVYCWRHFSNAIHSETCIIDECMMSDSTSESPRLTPVTMKPHRKATMGRLIPTSTIARLSRDFSVAKYLENRRACVNFERPRVKDKSSPVKIWSVEYFSPQKVTKGLQ